jgi:hypothetical protein
VQVQHAAVVVHLEVVVLAVAQDEQISVFPFVMFAVSAIGTVRILERAVAVSGSSERCDDDKSSRADRSS